MSVREPDGPTLTPAASADGTGGAPPTGYLFGLDGLRALAVIAAMAFHAGVLGGGFLGVDLFFVVSGFLITGILLEDSATHGRVRLGRFWVRRVRRLAPAALAVLAVTLVWAYRVAPPAMAQTTTKQLGWSLAYLTNWFALFGDVGYWGAAATKTPLNHLWSLAIEEQFYVIWPLAVAGLLAVTRRTRVIGALVLAGVLASGAWQWWVADHQGTERSYLGTDTRAVALLLGCLLALLLRHRAQVSRPRSGGSSRWWPVAAGVAVAWLGWSWVHADLAQARLYHGWLQSCSVAATVVVAAVVHQPTSLLTRTLSAAPLVWVGKRSYSLYLWHWPLWVMLSPAATGRSGATLWGLRVGATVAAAAVSYACIEQPIRNGRGSWPRVATTGGATVAALAAAVILFPPTLPVEQRSELVTLGRSEGSGPSGAPGGTGGLDILVAGDSWARNMGFALALADPDRHHTILNLGAGGCGLMTGADHECLRRQQESWAAVLASSHPDAALLVTGTADQIGVKINGQVQLPCQPAWDAAFSRELDDTIVKLGGPDRIPVFVTTVRDEPGNRAGSDCINRLLTAGATRSGATVLDLHAMLCPDGTCTATVDAQPVYDDTTHLGPAGQRWIGRWILEVLRREVKPRATVEAPASGTCEPDAPGAQPLAVATYTSRPDPSYPDSAQELTDGSQGGVDVFDPAWQGWKTPTGEVVLDLSTGRSVCSVTSTWLQEAKSGVQPPSIVEVYVSADRGRLGERLGGSAEISIAEATGTSRVAGRAPLTGRYVTLRFRAVAEWSFADEVTVLGPPPTR